MPIRSINNLIDEIKRINQEQALEAQALATRESSKWKRPKSYPSIYTGLSRAFNTQSGKPRYEISRTRPTVRPSRDPKDKKDVRTYSYSPITTMEAGLSIPYAYGTVSTKGNVITGALNSVPGDYPDPNAQTAKALVVVSKGPIDSFQSVTINGEAVATDIVTNTPDISSWGSLDYRLGYTTQPLPSPYSSVCENITCNHEVNYSGSISYLNVGLIGYDDVWFYFKFPNGLYVKGDSNDDLGYATCRIRVEFKKSSSSTWATAFETDFSSNKRTIVRAYKQVVPVSWNSGTYIDPYEETSYDFRVTKLTQDQTVSTQGVNQENTLYVDYITVCSRKQYSYPGIAYLDVSAISSERFNGSFNIESVIKGRLVKIYSTTSAYTVAWSNNPAWVCLDVLTQPIWTNGYPGWSGAYWVYGTLTSVNLSRHDGIDPAQIDIQSFIDWAAHCAGTVTAPAYDPADTTRCTFNGIFPESTSLWDAAQSVAEYNRAWLLPPSGTNKYRVALDQAKSVTQVFTTGSIIKDSLKETYTSMVERANELQVTFQNEDMEYQEDTLNVVYSSGDVSREDSLDLFGVTKASQAWRAAMLRLYYNAYVTCEVEFDAGQDAMTCQAGDVIGVQSELPQWGYGGRVVSANATTVVLDRPVNISDISTYNYDLTVRNSDDTLTTFTISVGSNPATGSTYTLRGTFSPVPTQYDPFAFGKTTIGEYKPFRVLEMADNGDGTYHIVGQEYNSSIYNMDTNTPAVPTPNYSSLTAFPSAENIDLDEILIKKQDGSISDCIDVYFTKPTGSLFAYAEIYYRSKISSGDSYPANWTYSGKTDLDRYRIMNVMVGVYYEVAVVTVNTLGRKAPIAVSPTSTVLTLGKADLPSDVDNFTAKQNGNVIRLSWDHIEDADLWGYELRYGASYTASIEIADIQSSNTYDWAPPLDGSYRFWIRSIDTSGNYSANASYADLTVSGAESYLNFVVYEDPIADYYAGGHVYNWTWDATGKFFSWTVGGDASPSFSPSTSPSRSPSASPSASPSKSPSGSPSISPSASPSTGAGPSTSVSPSKSPSRSPSKSPSVSPSRSPSWSISRSPSASPSKSPSKSPSASPSVSPSGRTQSPSASPSKSPSASPSKSPSVSPSTSAPTWYSDFTDDPNMIATYESDMVSVGSEALETTIRLAHTIRIYTTSANDQTYPTRTDQTYPEDTDQIMTVDDTPDDYTSHIYYAISSTGTPTEFVEYTAPIKEVFRYIIVRSITVCDNYSPNGPIALTHLKIGLDVTDIVFDIANYTISTTAGATILYSDYGYTLHTDTPNIQATVNYSNAATYVSLAPVIYDVDKNGFTIKLLDLVGDSKTGSVNIHVHGY